MSPVEPRTPARAAIHVLESEPDATALHPQRPEGVLEGLRIQASIGVGADGASYAATSPTLGAVELWRLRPGALRYRLPQQVVCGVVAGSRGMKARRFLATL
jgi:hypothetical protein